MLLKLQPSRQATVARAIGAGLKDRIIPTLAVLIVLATLTGTGSAMYLRGQAQAHAASEATRAAQVSDCQTALDTTAHQSHLYWQYATELRNAAGQGRAPNLAKLQDYSDKLYAMAATAKSDAALCRSFPVSTDER